MQIPHLYISHGRNGRGVYTAAEISKDSIIEVCHILHIPKEELPIIHKTVIHDYYFLWGEAMDEAVIALGYGSLYNHKLWPNANFILDLDNNTIDIVAIEDIGPGEEITINYHGEPGDNEPLWF